MEKLTATIISLNPTTLCNILTETSTWFLPECGGGELGQSSQRKYCVKRENAAYRCLLPTRPSVAAWLLGHGMEDFNENSATAEFLGIHSEFRQCKLVNNGNFVVPVFAMSRV
jgi:hypothetical protein